MTKKKVLSIDLTPALYKVLEPRERKVGRYNVSEIWAMLNGYLGVKDFFQKQAIDFEQAVRIYNGIKVHEKIETLLKEMGYETEVKKEMKWKDFVIVGKVDAINEKEIIEIKTSEGILGTAKKWHEHQVKMYLTMFEKERGIIAQPMKTSKKIYLNILKEIKRDDKWFERQMALLEKYHLSLKKYEKLSRDKRNSC